MSRFAALDRFEADLDALRPLAPEQEQQGLQKFRRQRHHPQARPTRRAFFAAGAAGAAAGGPTRREVLGRGPVGKWVIRVFPFGAGTGARVPGRGA